MNGVQGLNSEDEELLEQTIKRTEGASISLTLQIRTGYLSGKY